jgi:hypothetical protein
MELPMTRTVIDIADFTLPHAAQALVDDVEKRGGARLQLIVDDKLDAIAEAKWEGGRPTVILSPGARNAAKVAHEVAHFRQELDGWPQWGFPALERDVRAAGLSPGGLTIIASELQSVIEHHVFFADLAAMGLDQRPLTDEEIGAEFLAFLPKAQPSATAALTGDIPRRIAIGLARAQLEASDAMAEQAFAANPRLVHEIAAARRIVEIVRASPCTADGARAAMTACPMRPRGNWAGLRPSAPRRRNRSASVVLIFPRKLDQPLFDTTLGTRGLR